MSVLSKFLTQSKPKSGLLVEPPLKEIVSMSKYKISDDLFDELVVTSSEIPIEEEKVVVKKPLSGKNEIMLTINNFDGTFLSTELKDCSSRDFIRWIQQVFPSTQNYSEFTFVNFTARLNAFNSVVAYHSEMSSTAKKLLH